MNGSALDSIVATPPPKKGGKKGPMAGKGTAMMPPKGLAPAAKVAPQEAAEHVAAMGRRGDTELAHVTPGEIVLPPIEQMPPEFVAMVEQALADMGYTLAERTVATEGAGPENPGSGVEEFYDVGGGDEGPSGAAASDAASDAAADAADAAAGGWGGGGEAVNDAVAGAEGSNAANQSGISSNAEADGGFGGAMAGIGRSIGDIVGRPGFDPRDYSPTMAGLSGFAEAVGEVTGGLTEAMGGVPGTDASVDGPSGGQGAEGPSIAPKSGQSTPVDPGTSQQDPSRSLTVSRSVLTSPAVTDALGNFAGGTPLDSFLATPGPAVNPTTGTQMFAANARNDYLADQLGVPRSVFDGQGGFTAYAAQNDIPTKQIDALVAGFDREFDPETGAPRREESGGFYHGSERTPHNTYDSAGSVTGQYQAPTTTPAADDPTPVGDQGGTQTGVSANAIEAFSALTPRRMPRFGTARNRPNVNPVSGQQMFATRDNFDARYYLDSNPDVASGGFDENTAFDHYERHGKTEGRVGNREEQGFRDDGFTGQFGGGAAVDWRRQQAGARGYTDPATGGIRANLSSPRDAASSTGATLRQMDERRQARKSGFGGQFGADAFNRYASAYFDDDGDDATPWVARNDANVDRAGQDASRIRDVVRSAGYPGTFGAGGSDAWIAQMLASMGYAPSGDAEQDALRVNASSRQFDPMEYVPRWMRGGGAAAAINAAPKRSVTPTTAWGGAPSDYSFQPYAG